LVVPLFLCLFAILAAKAVFGFYREGRTRSREGEPPRSLRLGVKICSGSFAVVA
jgi:hypothetical protein